MKMRKPFGDLLNSLLGDNFNYRNEILEPIIKHPDFSLEAVVDFYCQNKCEHFWPDMILKVKLSLAERIEYYQRVLETPIEERNKFDATLFDLWMSFSFCAPKKDSPVDVLIDYLDKGFFTEKCYHPAVYREFAQEECEAKAKIILPLIKVLLRKEGHLRKRKAKRR